MFLLKTITFYLDNTWPTISWEDFYMAGVFKSDIFLELLEVLALIEQLMTFSISFGVNF